MAKFQHIKEILVRNFEHLINLASGEVARQFGVHVNDLRGNRRTQDVAYAHYFNTVFFINAVAEEYTATLNKTVLTLGALLKRSFQTPVRGSTSPTSSSTTPWASTFSIWKP